MQAEKPALSRTAKKPGQTLEPGTASPLSPATAALSQVVAVGWPEMHQRNASSWPPKGRSVVQVAARQHATLTAPGHPRLTPPDP